MSYGRWTTHAQYDLRVRRSITLAPTAKTTNAIPAGTGFAPVMGVVPWAVMLAFWVGSGAVVGEGAGDDVGSAVGAAIGDADGAAVEAIGVGTADDVPCWRRPISTSERTITARPAMKASAVTSLKDRRITVV